MTAEQRELNRFLINNFIHTADIARDVDTAIPNQVPVERMVIEKRMERIFGKQLEPVPEMPL